MSEKNEIIVSSQDDLRVALQEARLASGMSQQEASDEADINRSYVSRMENGEISLAYLDRLFDLLRIYGATVTVSFDESEK